MTNLTKWDILESEYVLETNWFKIRKDKVRLPDGTVYDEYYVKERNDWGALFCLTEDNRFILLETYKHGSQSLIYELPSGSIEAGETPEEGIRRELMEETGYRVKNNQLTQIGQLTVDPTYTQAKMFIFLADQVEKVAEPEPCPREIFKIHLVPLAAAEQFIFEKMGSFPESQVAAILLAKHFMMMRKNISSNKTSCDRSERATRNPL